MNAKLAQVSSVRTKLYFSQATSSCMWNMLGPQCTLFLIAPRETKTIFCHLCRCYKTKGFAVLDYFASFEDIRFQMQSQTQSYCVHLKHTKPHTPFHIGVNSAFYPTNTWIKENFTSLHVRIFIFLFPIWHETSILITDNNNNKTKQNMHIGKQFI